MFEDHYAKAVPDFIDNPAAETKETLLTGRWRSCCNGDSFVRTISGKDLGGELRGPIRFDPYRAKDLPRSSGPPSVNNLAVHRWFVPNLSAAEELELIRLAQLGDTRASIKLVQCFHKWILKLAGKRRGNYLLGIGADRTRGNELFDERIAAAFLAFWECVCTFKPELGNRLATHCWRRVTGAISDEGNNYRKRGIAGETLLQRVAFSRPYYPKITRAEGKQLQKRYRSFAEAFAALDEAYKEVDQWIRPYSYSTTGGDDDDGSLKGKLLANDGADDCAQNEPESTAGTGYDCFDNRRYQYGSRTIDRLVVDGAKRDARRLKEIGRRQYALELVDRFNKRFATRADEAQYRYGPQASNGDYGRQVQLRMVLNKPYRSKMTPMRDDMVVNLGGDFDQVREKEVA